VSREETEAGGGDPGMRNLPMIREGREKTLTLAGTVSKEEMITRRLEIVLSRVKVVYCFYKGT